MTEKQKEEVKGFVFYPREYHIVEGDILSSYATGISEGGQVCRVYIHPEDEHVEAAKNNPDKRVPSFEDFQESEPPCEADPENGPDNPISMILIEQASRGDDSERESDEMTMIGKWASVIKLNKRALKPPVGYGYLEYSVNTKSEEAQYILMQLAQVQEEIKKEQGDKLSLESTRDDLCSRLYEVSTCFFSAVMLDYKAIRVLSNENEVKEYLMACCNRYTKDGRYAGALIRARDDERVYISECDTFDLRYISKEGRQETPEEAVHRYLKYGGSKKISSILRSGRILEVIPTQRVNLGPMGNAKYKKDLSNSATSKIMKTYVEGSYHFRPDVDIRKEKAFLYSRIAVRMAKVKKGAGKGNQIASSVHAYVKPRGNAFQIDDRARPIYKVERHA